MINNISEEHRLYTKKDHMSRFRHFNGKHMYEQKLIDTKSQGEQITNNFVICLNLYQMRKKSATSWNTKHHQNNKECLFNKQTINKRCLESSCKIVRIRRRLTSFSNHKVTQLPNYKISKHASVISLHASCGGLCVRADKNFNIPYISLTMLSQILWSNLLYSACFMFFVYLNYVLVMLLLVYDLGL